jgi:hypothetical protein
LQHLSHYEVVQHSDKGTCREEKRRKKIEDKNEKLKKKKIELGFVVLFSFP